MVCQWEDHSETYPKFNTSSIDGTGSVLTSGLDRGDSCTVFEFQQYKIESDKDDRLRLRLLHLRCRQDDRILRSCQLRLDLRSITAVDRGPSALCENQQHSEFDPS